MGKGKVKQVMNFHSIEEIAREFDISAKDIKDLRRRLTQMMAEIHPDAHKGEFASPEDKEKFFRLREAIDFIDRLSVPESSLVPIDSVTELVEVVKDLVATKEQSTAELVKVVKDLVSKEHSQTAEERLSQQLERHRASITTKARVSILTSSAITAILTFLWLFPSTVQEHPILGQYIDISSPKFTIIWLYSILLTSAAWFVTKQIEAKRTYFQAMLKTEIFQNELFSDFCRLKIEKNLKEWIKKRGIKVRKDKMEELKEWMKDESNTMRAPSYLLSLVTEAEEITFTKDEFINYLLQSRRRSYLLLPRPRFLLGIPISEEIQPDIAQSLADIILERAEKQGTIRRIETRYLSEVYKLKVPLEVIA